MVDNNRSAAGFAAPATNYSAINEKYPASPPVVILVCGVLLRNGVGDGLLVSWHHACSI